MLGLGPIGEMATRVAQHQGAPPEAYETFQKKQDGAFKIVLKP